MKKPIAILAVFAMLMLLFACGEVEVTKDNVINVYRVVNPDARIDSELVRAEEVEVSSQEDRLKSAISAISRRSYYQELTRAAPDNVKILSYTLEEGSLVLEVTPGYLELTGMQKTLVDYCFALTLCEIDGVETVSVYVGGAGVTLGLMPDDAILYDVEKMPFERQLRLYFADSDGRYLGKEYRSLTVAYDDMIELHVMEEILKGPEGPGLISAIPEGTRLLGISTSNGVCTVNLSDEFLNNASETAVGGRLAVYSIVNSLTTISKVNKVRLAVNDVVLNRCGLLTIGGDLEANDSITSPPNSAKGEADVDIFMVCGDSLVAVPRIVVPDAYFGMEYTMTRLLMGGLDEPCFENAFPTAFEPSAVETRSGICYIDIPASALEGMTKDQVDLAFSALTATLSGVEGVNFVTVMTDGRVYAERMTID